MPVLGVPFVVRWKRSGKCEGHWAGPALILGGELDWELAGDYQPTRSRAVEPSYLRVA